MDRVAFNSRRFAVSFAARANRHLRPWGLTTARVDLLSCHRTILGRHGMVYQADLGALLGIRRSTMTVMLRRMERLGLITRQVSECDRRKKVVVVTPAGYAAFAHAQRLLDEGYYQSIIDINLLLIDRHDSLTAKRARLLRYIDVLRSQFGDQSRIPYPAKPWAFGSIGAAAPM